MKNIFVVLALVLVASISFAAADTLYYCEHKGGINGGWLDSSFVYTPDPANPEFTLEKWQVSMNEFKAGLKSVSVDNTDPVVKELMRCPNSLHDKPRFKVENGQIVSTADVLDITIPPGYKGINPDGTLIR